MSVVRLVAFVACDAIASVHLAPLALEVCVAQATAFLGVLSTLSDRLLIYLHAANTHYFYRGSAAVSDIFKAWRKLLMQCTMHGSLFLDVDTADEASVGRTHFDAVALTQTSDKILQQASAGCRHGCRVLPCS